MPNWISAAVLGVIGGFVVFGIVWAFLAGNFAKTDAEKALPPWPVVWAMAVALMVTALSFGGHLRHVLSPPDEYAQDRD
jgi:hypothetical protein